MIATAPDRILAIKLADLGDLLITEPAIRSLRVAYPHARIDILTTPAASALVSFLGDTYNVVTFPKHDFDSSRQLMRPQSVLRLARFGRMLRDARYDAVAIFHHLTTPAGALKFRALARATGASVVAGLDNGRGDFLTHRTLDLGFGTRHTTEYMLDVSRQLGGADVDPQPALNGSSCCEPSRRTDLPVRYAAVFPTTGPFAPGRNWPEDSFTRLSGLLDQEGFRPVLLGARDSQEAAQRIVKQVPGSVDLTGQTSVDDVITIVRAASVTITGDSFPGHLAAAVGTPSVSIFGPSNHRAWAPHGADGPGSPAQPRNLVVRRDIPCSPCLYTGYRLGRRNGCPVRTCLYSISPEDVMSAVRVVTGGDR